MDDDDDNYIYYYFKDIKISDEIQSYKIIAWSQFQSKAILQWSKLILQ